MLCFFLVSRKHKYMEAFNLVFDWILTFHPLLQRFAAVIMRIREPKTTALVFGSGKMVCTGAKSEEHSKLAARKVKASSNIVLCFISLAMSGLSIMQAETLLMDLSTFCWNFLLNNFYLILFSSAVCTNHPEAWVPSQVQGSASWNLDSFRIYFLFFHLDRMDSAESRISKSRTWLALVMWNFQFVWRALLILTVPFLM